MESSALKNRLQKNIKKLKTYLDRGHLEAYRIYNKDIPEYPYLIDIYQDRAVIYEQGKKLTDDDEPKRIQHQKDIESCLEEVFNIKKENQFFKIRQKQKGSQQYTPLTQDSTDYFLINEPPFKFWVNLERYLDTGLFLDHRPLRQHLHKNSQDKKVLNLFSYTCSLSVASALGGGTVTSIDMSRTYLDWGMENFKANDLDVNRHKFIQADVLKELPLIFEAGVKFDLIILDPPSFSNSKRMEDDLDIERDHPIMIRDCMRLLKEDGELYFSTNKRKFDLHHIIKSTYDVKEISQWTIPQDFHHTDIHRAFLLKPKKPL
jgi:23S rRNA (cytosine1962-C5)-methyltransferase/23S rRNA (guanine2445-N2)-methyltransferase / 23S rRNA (guanine2069-N7)-methyltransferase